MTRARSIASPLASLVGLCVAALALGACGSLSPSSRPGLISVVGAERQYADVLAQIGGRFVDAFAVLSSPSVDPHTFQAGTTVAQRVANARLVVQNGLGYDDFMGRLESATSGASRHVIVAARVVGVSPGAFNPHLWYAPRTMPAVASAIARALSSIAPVHAAYFRANLASFTASLTPWQSMVDAFRATHHGVRAAATEPVAGYLVAAMGIVVASPRQFQADVMNGVDPAPQEIAQQEALIDQHRVALFLYNRQVTDTLTSSLRDRARGAGVPVVATYEITPVGLTYQQWMLAETRAIVAAVAVGAQR